METKSTCYQTFILRFWVEHDPLTQRGSCRFSLEDTATGKRVGFARLESLVAFLVSAVSSLDLG